MLSARGAAEGRLVPPETHRALAIRAAEEGVSMNRLVGARLAARSL